MLLTLTLAPNREDQPRYVALVSYERVPVERLPEALLDKLGACVAAVDFVVPLWRLWEHAGPGGRLLNTRVTQLRRVPGRTTREWPRKLDREAPETENLRRARIRAVRHRAHVDETKGRAEPDWDRALQLRREAEERAGAAQSSSSGAASPVQFAGDW